YVRVTGDERLPEGLGANLVLDGFADLVQGDGQGALLLVAKDDVIAALVAQVTGSVSDVGRELGPEGGGIQPLLALEVQGHGNGLEEDVSYPGPLSEVVHRVHETGVV